MNYLGQLYSAADIVHICEKAPDTMLSGVICIGKKGDRKQQITFYTDIITHYFVICNRFILSIVVFLKIICTQHNISKILQ